MTPGQHPLRQVIDKREKANGDWHVRFDCGHIVNFGRGPAPHFTEYRCAECPRVTEGGTS